MKHSWYRFVVGLACLALIPGCGCPRKQKEAEEPGPVASRIAESIMERAIEQSAEGDADVEFKDGKLQIKTGEGEATLEYGEGKFEVQTQEGKFSMVTGENATIPDGFPKELQVYEGSKIVQVVTHEQGGMLGLETDDAVADVIAHYQQHFTDAGWEEQSSVRMPAMSMLVFKKGDDAVTINAAPVEGKTRVQQTFTRNAR